MYTKALSPESSISCVPSICVSLRFPDKWFSYSSPEKVPSTENDVFIIHIYECIDFFSLTKP